MAGCAEDEFVNILVLGSSNIKISHFIKLFAAYLKYDTCKEVLLYEPHLKATVENVTETKSHIIKIGSHKFHFIDTPGLQKSYRSYKEIIDILLYFIKSCRLHAIILLIEPDKKGSENYFEQYTAHFLCGLKQFAKNILYVLLNNDSCMFDQTYRRFQKAMDTINISALVPQKNNVFHLNEDAFFTLDENNWEESSHFCRDVFDYINGNMLKLFEVHCTMPSEESFLSLVYNMVPMLIEMYYIAEYNVNSEELFYISDYQKNVTVCYGEHCYSVKPMINGSSVRIPKFCHKPCVCTEISFNVENCTVFETSNKNCSVCNCDSTLHHRIMFQKEQSESALNPQQQKSLAMMTLAQLFYFIKCHGTAKSPSIKYCIDKFYKQKVGCTNYDVIIEKLNTDFETELKMYSKTQITLEKLLKSIYMLYETKAIIIPKLIDENFPGGLRLEIILKPQRPQLSESQELKLLKTECQNMKLENQNIKKEFDAMKRRLDQIINNNEENNLSNNNCKIQNIDKFNIK